MSQPIVSFFDIADGCYVQTCRAAPDGTHWITISPADTRRLIHLRCG
jgi:hypothetical protein